MRETDLVPEVQLRTGKRKPCICCGSDFGGLLVIRESRELKDARLELAAAIKSIHGLQQLIGRVAKLKAIDDARHEQRLAAERERLSMVLGNVPDFQAASPADLRIV